MPDALYWQVIEEMDHALEALAAETINARDAFRATNQRVRQGDRPENIISDMGRRDRQRFEEAIRTAQATVRRARAHYIRLVVEEEGMTLTETAKLMGISRQAVSALYQGAINESRATKMD